MSLYSNLVYQYIIKCPWITDKIRHMHNEVALWTTIETILIFLFSLPIIIECHFHSSCSSHLINLTEISICRAYEKDLGMEQ